MGKIKMMDANERPLVILKGNRKWISFGFGILILSALTAIFGAIFPVLRTGDYNSAWLYNNGNIIKNILLFYISVGYVVSVPFITVVILHRAGNYYFYDDHVELHRYWIKRKLIIPYNQMYVIRGSIYIIITTQELPSRLHPLQHFKLRYLAGIQFTTIFTDPKVLGIKSGLTRTWENPEDGPKVLQILKEKAFSYVEK